MLHDKALFLTLAPSGWKKWSRAPGWGPDKGGWSARCTAAPESAVFGGP